MSDAAIGVEMPARRSRKPLLLGLLLAALGGGGAFYAVWSGMIGVPSAESPRSAPDIAFVPVEPLVISLPPGARAQFLRLTAQLEVDSAHRKAVTDLMPRIQDIMNSYLRAVETTDLESPAALVRLRAQLLRRVQIVTGDGMVRDLLITEFVLN